MALMASVSSDEWEVALDSYQEALNAIASRKQDPTKLKSLDSWYWQAKARSQQRKGLDHETLCKVMQWKLSRGTFRPGLLQKAESNKDTLIKTTYEEVLAVLQPVEGEEKSSSEWTESMQDASTKAIKVMDKNLTGIGPATASAILSRSHPNLIAFMSDDAMLGSGLFSNPRAIKYDVKTFSRFNALVQAKARELNGSGSSLKWTGEDVAKALWSRNILKTAFPGREFPTTSKGTKRSSASVAGPALKRPSTEASLKRPASAESVVDLSED